MSPSMNLNPGVQQQVSTPDRQSSMLPPSPSLSARQPLRGLALMQANQEILELRMVPAPTLAALRQEFGLSDREPNQMTPAERQRLLGAYRQRRGPYALGPAAGLQLPDPAQLRAPPQMNGSTINGGVPRRGQPPMGNPMNMGIGQPPLDEPQSGVSLYPQGYTNQPGLMDEQGLMYRMQNLQLEGTMPPQAMNSTIQSSPSSATRSSNDPTMHPRAPTNQGPTHAINGAAPNSNISQPPESSIPVGTPLNPRPIMNHQSVLTDSVGYRFRVGGMRVKGRPLRST